MIKKVFLGVYVLMFLTGLFTIFSCALLQNSSNSSSLSSSSSSSTGSSSSSIGSQVAGTLWTCATTNAAFPKRGGNALMEFNNALWVIGGNNSNACLNDVWYSHDGTNWNFATLNSGIQGEAQLSA